MSNQYLDMLAPGAAANADAADPEKNPYLGMLQGAADQRRQALAGSLSQSVATNPDEFSTKRKVAGYLGYPVAALDAIPGLADQAKVRKVQADTAQAPVLQQRYTDADFAKLAHDDSGVLAGLETTIGRAVRYVMGADRGGGLPGDLYGAVRYGAPAGAAGAFRAVAETAAPLLDFLEPVRAVGGNPLRRLAEGFGSIAQANSAALARLDNPEDGVVMGGVRAGVRSLGQNLITMPLALLPGGQAAALTSMAAGAGGTSYQKGRDKGLSPGQSLAFGASDAVVEYATERLPMAQLIGGLKAGAPLLQTLVKNAALEVPGEQIATVLQDMNEWAALNPEKPFSSYLAERPSAAAQTLIATLIGTGGQVAVLAGVQKAADAMAGVDRQAKFAQQQSQALGEMMTLAEASKLRERDPESFRAFMQEAADANAPKVFVDVKALQAGTALEELAQAMPDLVPAIQEALQTGGDLAIATADLATVAPGQTFAQALIEHGRLGADAMSKAEADAYMADRGNELQAEVQRVLGDRQVDDVFKGERDKLAEGFKAQLADAGRFTGNVNDAYAAMLADFYAVTAAKAGALPGELAARYPLRIQAKESTGAVVLEQSKQGAVPFDALAVERDQQAVLAQALVNGLGRRVQGLGDVLVGETIGAELYGVVGVPALAAVLAHVRRAVLDDPKVLDAVVGAVPVDVVNNLFGSKSAAKVALHDQAVLQDSPAFNADLPVTAGADTAGPVGFLVRQAALRAAELLRVAGSPGRKPKKRSGAVGAGQGDGFSQSDSRRARAQIVFGANITSTPTVISLFKDANLSSFLHESGHFFLEVQADLAGRIRGQARDGAALTPEELSIAEDMDRILAWFGIKDTPEASALDQWNALTLEERRGYHEQWARGFEAYAFEGNAPSLELAGVFQRFRAWLLQVYKKLDALNVELTDEVRSVMGRMLASTEAIQQAEAARKMGAIFATPDQAGMTLDEFKAYHGLALDATQEAIANLQARGLRDMQWLSNARSRKMRELQRQHDELRREVRREVRAEVMAQPVYQAWSFLTGKAGPGEAAQPVPKRGRSLDASVDSLLVAVAKLGGIARESAGADLGVHADYFKKDPVGLVGAPVFRASGGMTADRMAEALVEAGYLLPDAQGQHSLHDLEDKIAEELRGQPVYSIAKDFSYDGRPPELGDEVQFGKLDTNDLRLRYGTGESAIWRKLSARRMTSDTQGVDADVVALRVGGFDSGDALVRALADAEPPGQVVEAMTDQRMLEQHGDLATPEGLERAVDKALHNDTRGRMVATELSALARMNQVREKVPGQRNTVDVLARAAKQTAEAIISRLKVRDIRPAQYQAAEVRAARKAEKALAAGDVAEAAAEKRNQLIQHKAAQAAHAAQDEVRSALDYLRRFEKRPASVDPDYLDQIEQLLEGVDLRQRTTNREVDRRKSLLEWIEHVRETENKDPDIPPELLNAASLKSWREMTLEELRGLRDTVKQIEHLGRTKNRLLTAKDQREFDAARDAIAESVISNAGGRQANTRSAATMGERWLEKVKGFGAAHIKAATWARIFDGGKDGGPVWEYIIRPANAAGDMETTMRAEATAQLHELMKPLLAGGKLQRKGVSFPSIGRSLTREQVLAIGLNMGNEGNIQRLLGGEGWTAQQLKPVLDTITSSEWQAIQAVWDHFESYRPLIGAKERRVFGKEPEWVQPLPLRMKGADGVEVDLRGGYFPIRYDPRASGRAEEFADAEEARQMMSAAFVSSTTRRGFTKSRAEEVRGRPLLYSLSTAFTGLHDVIHDLAWHEWLIDVNKLLRSSKINDAIREHYGPEAVRQLKTWVQDVAAGERGLGRELDSFLGRLRQGASVAGLGFNVVSALTQPLGMTQSIVRVGAGWVGKGVAQYLGNPAAMTRRVNEQSEFMKRRAQTRFRELNELNNQIEGMTAARRWIGTYSYWLMMRVQQTVDVPTWLGAYEKAASEGNDEARAVALADQAVIDAQGSGMVKDLSSIERGGPAQKLFTVFYSYMNTALNLGATQATAAPKTAAGRAKLAADMLMLYTVPVVLMAMLKDALVPGDSGDWDDPEKIIKKLLGEQLGMLLGLFVGVRELAEVAKTAAGLSEFSRDYSGPAGLRAISDAAKLAKQVNQGEFDDAFRKAAINAAGSLFGLPAAQINRTITGGQALASGDTQNPAALLTGYQEPR